MKSGKVVVQNLGQEPAGKNDQSRTHDTLGKFFEKHYYIQDSTTWKNPSLSLSVGYLNIKSTHLALKHLKIDIPLLTSIPHSPTYMTKSRFPLDLVPRAMFWLTWHVVLLLHWGRIPFIRGKDVAEFGEAEINGWAWIIDRGIKNRGSNIHYCIFFSVFRPVLLGTRIYNYAWQGKLCGVADGASFEALDLPGHF